MAALAEGPDGDHGGDGGRRARPKECARQVLDVRFPDHPGALCQEALLTRPLWEFRRRRARRQHEGASPSDLLRDTSHGHYHEHRGHALGVIAAFTCASMIGRRPFALSCASRQQNLAGGPSIVCRRFGLRGRPSTARREGHRSPLFDEALNHADLRHGRDTLASMTLASERAVVPSWPPRKGSRRSRAGCGKGLARALRDQARDYQGRSLPRFWG